MNDNRMEMAVQGTHDVIVRVLKRMIPDGNGKKILDIGAGQGGLSDKLKTAGFEVTACDLYPENFCAPGITCLKVDADGCLPFEDHSIDVALAIELIEHIDGHKRFFSEVHRILKPGGKLLFSTPNILSLKSRILFMQTGYFYSFGTLEVGALRPAEQHISPFTLDRYRWLLDQCGLRIVSIETDKIQRSSLLWSPLVPVIRLMARMKQGKSGSVKEQNSITALFGRKLIICAEKYRI